MADAWKTYPIEFSGGLISNLSPLQQGINAPGSARTLRNMIGALNANKASSLISSVMLS